MSNKFKGLAILFCISLAFMHFSCKSAPKPEESVEPVEEVEVVSEDIVEVEKVEEPSVDDALLLELENVHAKIEIARKEAIQNSADKLYEEPFSFAEREYEAHKSFVQTKDLGPEHIASAQNVLNRYEALNYLALAEKAKQRVDGFNFKSYDEAAYVRGEEKFADLEKSYLDGLDTEIQKTNAKEAYLAFQSILNKAFAELAHTKRQEVIELRAEADAIKAGTADKAGYNSAMLKFTAGEKAFSEKEYEEAYNSYLDAFDALKELYERVLIKRSAALRAMEEAKIKSEEVDRLALEADEIAPLVDEEGSEE